jgi:hypothetical protein
MTKETVMVHVPGSPFGITPGTKEIFKGPYTHMRSEGTWMLGVALNMARHGHPTTIIEYPWGDINTYPLPNNITLTKEFKGNCDIFIDIGWEEVHAVKNFSNINARHYIHGWGGNPAHCSFLEYFTKKGINNHYMARTSRCFKKLFDAFPLSIYMPAPLIDEINKLPNINSKKMLWANRGAFHPSYTYQSEKLLEFMERHIDYQYTVLLYGDIKERAIGNNRHDIVERFEKLPDARLLEPYSGFDHDEFLKELGESKILLANGQPSAHPQTLEAVCMGCIPVLWLFAENHFQDPNGTFINSSFTFDGPNIDKILDDQELHIKYFKALAEVTKDHEYDNSYKILMDQIRDKEK